MDKDDDKPEDVKSYSELARENAELRAKVEVAEQLLDRASKHCTEQAKELQRLHGALDRMVAEVSVVAERALAALMGKDKKEPVKVDAAEKCVAHTVGKIGKTDDGKPLLGCTNCKEPLPDDLADLRQRVVDVLGEKAVAGMDAGVAVLVAATLDQAKKNTEAKS